MGIQVSEYRIESGLNCVHAFATDGLMCGPIMEEFKKNKQTLYECRNICNDVLSKKDKATSLILLHQK